MQTVELLISAAVIVGFIVYWIFAFLILYHLTRFGVGVQPKRFAAVYLFGSIVIFSISVVSFGHIDISTLPLP